MKKLVLFVLAFALLFPCLGVSAADAPLLLRGQEVEELYSFDYQNRAYHRVSGDADMASLTRALAVLPVSKGTEKTTVSDGARGFLAFLKDGTRLAWYVTSTELSDDVGVIRSTQNARDTLLNLAGKYNAKYPGSAQKIAYINPSKIKWLQYDNFWDDKYSAKYSGNDPVAIQTIVDMLKSLEVKPSPTIRRFAPNPDDDRPVTGSSFMVHIYTDTGVMFFVVPTPGVLLFESEREDIRYQIAKPEQFEFLLKTVSARFQTLAEAGYAIPDGGRRWSTTSSDAANKIKSLLKSRSGEIFTSKEYFNGMHESLQKSLVHWDLNLYDPIKINTEKYGTSVALYLPAGDSDKGFCYNTSDEKGWYLTEQATKELKALMQPMTRL